MQAAGDDANLIDETIKLNEVTRDMVLPQKEALENLEDMGVKACKSTRRPWWRNNQMGLLLIDYSALQ